MERNITVLKDSDGKSIVFINDIIFKGRQRILWKDVKNYLKSFIGDMYEIIESSDEIYIDNDFPNEFARSNYTNSMKGTLAKAKANAAQGIPEMIEIASNKRFVQNFKQKHNIDAKFGWYRYTTRFALPAYNYDDEIIRYNVFKAILIVRHSEDGKLYLYDVIKIKKELSNPLEHYAVR